MRVLALRAAVVLAAWAAAPARGAEPAPPPAAGDPVLARLVEEAVASRPELRQAEAAARAERERVPQAGALPDPLLLLGIQNDGFGELQIGKMETSYWQVTVTQGLPWPGKRGLRTDVARQSAAVAEAGVSRAPLHRGGRPALLRGPPPRARPARAPRAARGALAEVGGDRSNPVRDRRRRAVRLAARAARAEPDPPAALEPRGAGARAAVQAPNRMRGRPLDEAIATTAGVRDLGVPALRDAEGATADALDRSPELASARASAARADRQEALARRERFPDLALSAGVMPRGGLEPMWTATLSVGLPIWSSRKQGRAVAESAARAGADASAAEGIERTLRLRVADRRSALVTLLDTIRLYREGCSCSPPRPRTRRSPGTASAR